MRALRRVPVHMSCNVTVLDRDGSRSTVYLAPDRPAHATSRSVATSYQGKVEWAPYAAAIWTVERQERLEELLAAGADAGSVVAACLRPPHRSPARPGLASPRQADLDRAAGLARLEGRLRGGGRPAGDRAVRDPEDAAVPRAGQAAVGQLAVGQRT